MIYIILICFLFLALLLFWPKDKKILKSNKATSQAFKIGGLLGFVWLLLRFLPLRFLDILFLLLPFVGHYKKSSNNRSDLTEDKKHMTKAQAYEILGLKYGADKMSVLSNYKKLMLKNHPDKGGSEYIAKQLIKAKEVLLNDKGE